MLNEWKEYGYYLSGDVQLVPLTKEALDGQKGFRRPLQILARGFLDKCAEWEEMSGKPMPHAQKLSACKWFLRVWTEGLSQDAFDGFADLPPLLQEQFCTAGANNFMKFAASQLMDEKKLAKLKEDVGHFNDAPYGVSVNLSWNNFNKIYYDQIVADAMERVPLRKQCLVVAGKSAYEDIRCAQNMRPIALAVAILYLQAQGENDTAARQEYIPIPYAQVGNWLDCYFTNKGAGKTSVPEAVKTAVTTDEESLFEKQTMPTGNKLRLNPQWRKIAKLVNEDDLPALKEDGVQYWIVRDEIESGKRGLSEEKLNKHLRP